MHINSNDTENRKRMNIITRIVGATLISLLIISMNYAKAGEADVVNVKISAKGNDLFKFDVTVRHDDAGWEHYANRWDILDLNGNVLGSRVLAHPHDHEQPFTRSLTLRLPENITTVVISAHDSVHGTGGATREVTVPHT